MGTKGQKRNLTLWIPEWSEGQREWVTAWYLLGYGVSEIAAAFGVHRTVVMASLRKRRAM